eukprot:14317276-Alexandrium_andersonii.AAC.2
MQHDGCPVTGARQRSVADAHRRPERERAPIIAGHSCSTRTSTATHIPPFHPSTPPPTHSPTHPPRAPVRHGS